MHIPDGFLDAKTCVATAALASAGVGAAIARLRRGDPARTLPTAAMMGAFVFAAQMVNFPVAGGTSGHILGAALCAISLGADAAVLVMTSVLLVQCLLFQDGGLTALGANVCNMGIATSWVAWAVFRGLAMGKPSRRRIALAAGAAGWASVVVAALMAATELVWSGRAAPQVVFPAMLGWHCLIGLGEGVVTAVVVRLFVVAQPDLLPVRVGGRAEA